MKTLILFILLLSLIIVIHELGHLAAAKMFGVYCYEFSFGMGPCLWKKKTKETQYSIRAVPIGGYVAMAGETDGDELYPDANVPEGRRITEISWWKKVIIMLAGVFNNFVLAWVIFSFVILAQGGIAKQPAAAVGEVTSGSPAEKAGLLAGDRILAVTKENGESVKPKTFLELQTIELDDTPMVYTIQRGDDIFEVSITPEYNEEADMYLIGIRSPEGEIVEANLLNCWYYGFYEMGMLFRLMAQVLGQMIHGIGLKNMSGPVGIYQMTNEYAKLGFSSYMFLVAELSMNVGIFNLLPLPILDGGQVIVTLVEAAVRRPLNKKIKVGIMVVCWILMLVLMVFATWNDIVRILS